MKYRGKPLECEAFMLEMPQDKFHRWLRDRPQWFQNAYSSGAVQVTVTGDSMYATIYDGRDTRKAHSGDMIVRNNYGRIFPMSADEFNEAFFIAQDPPQW